MKRGSGGVIPTWTISIYDEDEELEQEAKKGSKKELAAEKKAKKAKVLLPVMINIMF